MKRTFISLCLTLPLILASCAERRDATTNEAQDGAALNVGANGELRVLWYTAGEAGAPGLYWSESTDGGRTFAPRRTFINGQVRGTPLLLPEGNNDFMAVWESDDDGQARIAFAQHADDGRVSASITTTDGAELPSAAVTSGQLFVAYISKVNKRHEIWLARAKVIAKS